MSGDDLPFDKLREQVEQLAKQVAQNETDIGRLWNQLNGLRETLENIQNRPR